MTIRVRGLAGEVCRGLILELGGGGQGLNHVKSRIVQEVGTANAKSLGQDRVGGTKSSKAGRA